MDKQQQPRPDEQRTGFEASNCTCSFCLMVFSLQDLSKQDIHRFRRHLQAYHGLVIGMPEA